MTFSARLTKMETKMYANGTGECKGVQLRGVGLHRGREGACTVRAHRRLRWHLLLAHLLTFLPRHRLPAHLAAAAESLQKGAKKVAATFSIKGRSSSRDGRPSAGDEQPGNGPAA